MSDEPDIPASDPSEPQSGFDDPWRLSSWVSSIQLLIKHGCGSIISASPILAAPIHNPVMPSHPAVGLAGNELLLPLL